MRRTLWSLLLLGLVLPLCYVAWRALAGGGQELPRLGTSYLFSVGRTTILLVAASATLALVLGTAAAMAVVYVDFPGRRFLAAALCLPFVLPPYLVAMVYGWLAHRWYKLGIEVENVWAAALCFALTLYPYVYLPLKVTLQSQSVSYVEMGRSLGLSRFQVCRKVVLPLCAPALFLGGLLVSMAVLSDYGVAHLLGLQTASVAIYDTWFSMYSPTLAARLSLAVGAGPLLALAAFAWITRSRRFENLTNRPAPGRRRRPAGARGWLVAAATALPVLAGFVVPGVLLSWWCSRTLRQMNLGTLFGDVARTVILAVSTAAICLLLAAVLVFLARHRGRGRMLPAATWVVSANFVVPAMVLAIAMLFITRDLANTRLGPLFSETILLLLCACVLRYLCFAYFSLVGGMRGLSRRLDEAVLTLGKGRAFAVFRVQLPLLRRYLVIGSLLVFICVARELTLALVLRPFDYSNLALRLYERAGVTALPESSVYALCLVVLSIYPVFAMSRWFSQERAANHA